VWNSLSQALLKLTTPGVPDIYQGSELWDFRLVDPDNRAPVDYGLRRGMLEELRANSSAEQARNLLNTVEDGRVKLYVMWKALSLRQRNPELFRQGDYTPLMVQGLRASHVCSFARRKGNSTVIVAVPLLMAGVLSEQENTPIGATVWGDTRLILPAALAPEQYTNAFTAQQLAPEENNGYASLAISKLLQDFPVALISNLPL
jgi:(1->4)-alpha-D-glucan 1-alpha-D-glucosylmutase